jgi:carboxypeptidase D
VDQPVGTGFSYVSTSAYTKTLDQAAEEVVYFLQRFIEVYPEYKAGNGVETYIAGESFAGQYIPFTASALLKTGSRNPIDLKGIAIGNGFIDPKSQAGSELEMMVKANIWKESSKVSWPDI